MLSKNLEISLHRALALAKKYKHEYATLEHLLYALTDDQDAQAVMRGCGINLSDIKKNISEFLEQELTSLVVDELEESRPTAGFQRVIHRAAIHVLHGLRDQLLAQGLRHMDTFAGGAQHENAFHAACDLRVDQPAQR